MPRSFIKNIIQEIRHSLGRFLSILLIVAIGVAFFAGIKASAPDMKYSADQYFDSYNVQDIQVYSTLGITKSDVKKIKSLKGVKEVQPCFSIDTLTQLESSELVIKVITYQDDQSINKIRLVDGRMPEKENECLVQADSATSKLYGGYKIGDTISLSSGTEDSLKDTLKNDTYTIVGTCYNPNYLSYELGSSSIGSGSVNSFIYVQDSNRLVDYYTEADVTVTGAKELNTYDDAYFDKIDPVVKEIEDIANSRIQIRINKNQKEIQDAQDELDQKIADGQKKIDQGQKKITKAEAQIEENEAKLQTAKSELDSGWQQYYEKLSLLSNLDTIQSALAQIEQAEAKLDELKEQKQQCEQGIQKLKTLQSSLEQLSSLKEQRDGLNIQYEQVIQALSNPDLSDEQRAQLEATKATLESSIAQLDTVISSMESQLSKYTLDGVQSQLNELNDNLDQINAGIEQIEEASSKKEELLSQQQQLLSAQTQLESAYATLSASQAEYDSGIAQLQEAKETLESSKQELTEAQNTLDQQKSDAQKKIDDAQDEIDELEGEWYVLDRDSHYSYRDYGACADRMDGIAKVFPVFFFLVAALVCMTTMTRMVDEQRSEIGTLKALGYSKSMIASKYLIYALIASILGSVLGCAIGLYLFPTVIFTAWNMLYNLETIYYAFQPGLMLASGCSVTAITLLATIYSIQAELKDVPSQLMRPKSGKAGKKILLERVPLIWNRLSFLHKVTARNIFRYKKRFYMTIIGISGCSALVLAGFGINDSISDIVNQQYGNIYHYNSSVAINHDSKDLQEKIISFSGVSELYDETQLPVTINMDDKDYSATVHIIDDTEHLNDFTTLQSVKGNETYQLDDSSIIISQKIASKLNISIGDSISFKDANDKEIQCKVTGIYKNYVGHHIFVTRKMYESWKSHAKTTSTYLLKQTKTTDRFEKKLGNQLMNLEEVKSVTFYSSLEKNFSDIISSLSMIVILLVVSAAALAFVVLYNLSNVNISERIREIATIKVLGFLPNEVAAYVNRESIILTMIGAFIGLFVGIGLHHLIMNLAEMDDIMFGRTIKPVSYFIAFFMTLAFACIINLFMRRKLRQVQMVESLKAVE